MIELIVSILFITFFCWGLGIIFKYDGSNPKHLQMAGFAIGRWAYKINEEIEFLELEKSEHIKDKERLTGEPVIKLLESKRNPDHFTKDSAMHPYAIAKDAVFKMYNKKLNNLSKSIIKKQRLYFAFKPILFCSTCFPSFWGSIIYWCYFLLWLGAPFDYYLIFGWIVSIVSATGLVYLLQKLH